MNDNYVLILFYENRLTEISFFPICAVIELLWRKTFRTEKVQQNKTVLGVFRVNSLFQLNKCFSVMIIFVF